MAPPQRRKVVCLALGRMKVEDGYLLTADRKRYRNSGGTQRIWGPPSDILEVPPSEFHALCASLNAQTPTETLKLSFSVPLDRFSGVANWFESHPPNVEHARDLIVQHLAEAWNDTTPLLLHPGISNAQTRLVGQTSMDLQEVLPGPYANQKTHYRLCVFSFDIPPKAVEAIRRITDRPQSPLYLATKDEITNGRTSTGEQITPFAPHLLFGKD